MSGVPNVFGSATSSIPLSQLDVNFNTPLYIGNTSVGLGNTVTSLGNVTLTNTTISGLSGGTANGVVYINSSNVAVASPTVLAFDGTNLGIGVTPSASVYASSRNLFVGQATNLIGRTTINYTSLNTNVYEAPTSSAATFINSSSAAAQYYQYLGAHYWQTSTNTPSANSSITWNTAMTLNTSGTLTFAQSGQGIQFTNSSALANSTLNDYETGTWTPNQGSGLTVVGSFSSAGVYTKIGRMVYLQGYVSGSTSIAVSSAGLISSNTPFTSTGSGIVGLGGATNGSGNVSSVTNCGPSSTNLSSGSAIAGTTTFIYFSLIYQATF